jgi:hypothetical protein
VGKGANPRGLSLGNNNKILFQRTCAFYVFFIISSSQGEKRAKGMHADACSSMGDKCQPWCMQIK